MLQAQQTFQVKNENWLGERHRYEVLSHIYRMANADCSVGIGCAAIAQELGFPREEVFQILHELEFLGFLAYVGSGPRVRLSPRAVAYLLLDSGRRRSIRDAE